MRQCSIFHAIRVNAATAARPLAEKIAGAAPPVNMVKTQFWAG
jgi:hypothetical protein